MHLSELQEGMLDMYEVAICAVAKDGVQAKHRNLIFCFGKVTVMTARFPIKSSVLGYNISVTHKRHDNGLNSSVRS